MQRNIDKLCIVVSVSAIAIGFAGQAYGYCAKCVKIEEEREKEQAAHPTPWNYYDDMTNLHSSDNSATDVNKSPQNNKKYLNNDNVNIPSAKVSPYNSSKLQDMSDEEDFLRQSQNRMDQMHQSNKNMSERDRKMIREGYDANQQNNNGSSFAPQMNDPNNPQYSQEGKLRGSPSQYREQPQNPG